jgi:proteic killer suppression protein
MIKSFKDKRIEELIKTGVPPRGLPTDIVVVARRKLAMLDAAVDLRDLAAPPNNRLEALKRDRKGQYSIRINDQWRICFRWNGGAEDVEIVDYH